MGEGVTNAPGVATGAKNVGAAGTAVCPPTGPTCCAGVFVGMLCMGVASSRAAAARVIAGRGVAVSVVDWVISGVGATGTKSLPKCMTSTASGSVVNEGACGGDGAAVGNVFTGAYMMQQYTHHSAHHIHRGAYQNQQHTNGA